MILPIYLYGHPVLRKVAEEIGPDYDNFKKLIEDMWETMYHSEGVGLAAPQVGLAIRLFVVDGTSMVEDFPELEGFKRVFVNPTIIEKSETKCSDGEGCLSIPGIREDVSRPDRILIRYQNENFEWLEEELHNYAARIVQHEYDHIDGKLFIDYLSPLRKRLLKSKLNAISVGKVNVDYRIKIAR